VIVNCVVAVFHCLSYGPCLALFFKLISFSGVYNSCSPSPHCPRPRFTPVSDSHIAFRSVNTRKLPWTGHGDAEYTPSAVGRRMRDRQLVTHTVTSSLGS
jgi:hypothetical protein